MSCCYLNKKYLFLVLLSFLPFTNLSAQTINDSIQLGGGDSVQCFYRLQNSNKTYRPLNEWDLAFQTQGITFGIWINEAAGEKLYVYPKGDTTAWNSIDTTGLSTWTVLHNSTTTWNTGAFNQNSPFPFDVGWGVYTGPPDHYVFGDSINLVLMPNGQVKKVWIQSLKNKVYYFKYANLDGSDAHEDSLNKLDFTDKSNGYYSFAQHAVIDREPDTDKWELLFTKQLTAPDSSTSAADIPFGSVYLNHNVVVAKVTGTDALNYNPPFGLIVDSTLTVIGISYKHLDNSVWVVYDTTTYYVMDHIGGIYQLTFTGIDSSNGKITINKTGILSTGITETTVDGLKISTFPNPASSQLNVVMTATKNGPATIIVSDITGRQILNTQWDLNAGTNSAIIPTQSLTAGMWLITVKTDAGLVTSKFIKSN